MKKFFLIIALATMLSSCTTTNPLNEGDEIEVIEIEYEGHEYLLFEGYGIVHNPNCKCTKQED